MLERRDIDLSEKKEALSSDKLRSVLGLLIGARALHFDALLNKVPSSYSLTRIQEDLEKPEIESVIFDVDGTLVPPYAEIPKSVIQNLEGYLEEGRRVAVYTNSPHTDRLNAFREAGIVVAETGVGKPSLLGFQRLCDQQQMDPAHTAMVGNFPVTDMPLVPNKESPFFPMNILVSSVPPDGTAGSLKKRMRAQVFHLLNQFSTDWVVFRHDIAGNRRFLRTVF